MLNHQFVKSWITKNLFTSKRNVIKSKSKIYTSTVKEIRFGPQTDEHDYEFKERTLKILERGC
jgi:translation initiation factor IF-3